MKKAIWMGLSVIVIWSCVFAVGYGLLAITDYHDNQCKILNHYH